MSQGSTTARTRNAKSRTFAIWEDFCEDLGVSPTLGEFSHPDGSQDELQICYLLVFALRYRRRPGQRSETVRSGTVQQALAAVGQGIAKLDPRNRDPRFLRNTGNLHPLLASFYKSMTDEDDPQERAFPCNIVIVKALREALDTRNRRDGMLNARVIDLVIVAHHWLLRPAEFAQSPDDEARTQAFRFCDIYLTVNGTVYPGPNAPLYDVNDIQRITHGVLTFTDQKNAVRGEQVGHEANSDPFFCPAKALGRITYHLLKAGAPPDQPIFMHYNPDPTYVGWYPVKTQHITNALRHAASSVQAFTNIDYRLLSAKSLRPGGATALMCASIDSDYVALLGRWKSDAMFRYLRTQAASYHQHYSQRMLDHGAYTFAPGTCHTPDALPQQAPPQIAALLAHRDLYD